METAFEFTGDALATADLKAVAQIGPQLYVVQFASNVIKVGYSADGAQRVATHRQAAVRRGDTITAAWISAPHGAAFGNEASLIRFCQKQGTACGATSSEHFAGLDFAAVVEFAKSLPTAHESRPTRRRVVPLDPQSPAGIAAAEAITEMLASLEIAIEDRRRNRQPVTTTNRDSEAA